MKTNKLITIFWTMSIFAILMFVPLSARSQKKSPIISGTVKSKGGKALEGVCLSISGPGLVGQRMTASDKEGTFAFTPIQHRGTYRLVAEYPGFRVQERDIEINYKDLELDIVLTPFPETKDSSANGNNKDNSGIPIFRGENLTSNRFDRMPVQTLQVVIFYDGSTVANPQLKIGYRNGVTGKEGWITVKNIENFGSKIETREYYLNGAKLNYKYQVSGVVNDGVIDGLAFGLYWKDGDSHYHMRKSNDVFPVKLSHRSDFVGAWPIALGFNAFVRLAPQLTDNKSFAQAMATIFGARYLGNGNYRSYNPQSNRQREEKDVSSN